MNGQTDRRRLLIGARVVAGAAGLFCAAVAVAFLFWGLYFSAIQLSATAFACLAGAVSTWRIGTTDLSPLAETDCAGTTFRPDRGLDKSRQLASFALIVNVVPLLFLPLLVTPSWAAAIPGLTALVFALLAFWNVRRRARSTLRLSPGGVELRHHTRRRSCDWTQIRDITGEAPKLWMSKPSELVIIVCDTESLRLPAGTFGPNAAAMRALVEFYWRHPAFRGELTDGSAPRRLAATLGVFR